MPAVEMVYVGEAGLRVGLVVRAVVAAEAVEVVVVEAVEVVVEAVAVAVVKVEAVGVRRCTVLKHQATATVISSHRLDYKDP